MFHGCGSGLMDALSNPNAFASGQAKKDEKMKELGIEESAQSKAATTGGKVKEEEVKRGQFSSWRRILEDNNEQSWRDHRWILLRIAEELKFDPINVESLRKDKNFIKANKKGVKDLETMQKKHTKEKEAMMKNHCTAIEKLAKGKKLVDSAPSPPPLSPKQDSLRQRCFFLVSVTFRNQFLNVVSRIYGNLWDSVAFLDIF